MNSYLVTIDGGTTNTRAVLWHGDEPAASAFRETGVRNTAISDSVSPLQQAVKECIDEVMKKEGITFEDVEGIVASGMLTSNVGLVEIPHLTAPVSAGELSRGIRQVLIEGIAPVPICFIPGVKNQVSSVTMDSFGQMDMMRGEETEAFAILKDRKTEGDCLIVLPGSHMKFVSVDGAGAITGCLTTISGELLSAITCNTILANSVDRQFVPENGYDREMVLYGAKAAAESGLGRACFSGRILSTFVTDNSVSVANFLLGAVLQGDAAALKSSSAVSVTEDTEIIIAGKNPLRQALYDILREDGAFGRLSMFEAKKGCPLGAAGAKYLYELKLSSLL